MSETPPVAPAPVSKAASSEPAPAAKPAARNVPEKGAGKAAAPADERPYPEELWKRAQQAYFRLLDIRAGRARPDPQAVSRARQLCLEAEQILRFKTDNYDAFLARVQYSEKFLSDSARLKKSELYLKQLFLKKQEIEELVQAMS
jgi:hypothetical protein